MTFNDINRQKAWMRQVQMLVKSVGEPQETQYGWCQAVEATDSRGLTEWMNYFYEHSEVQIDPSETGVQFFDIKWDAKNNYYKCIPSTPPVKQELVPDRPAWDKIALGKCRHGILCALLSAGWNPYHINEDGEQINRLAEFSMTGKVEEDESA